MCDSAVHSSLMLLHSATQLPNVDDGSQLPSFAFFHHVCACTTVYLSIPRAIRQNLGERTACEEQASEHRREDGAK